MNRPRLLAALLGASLLGNIVLLVRPGGPAPSSAEAAKPPAAPSENPAGTSTGAPPLPSAQELGAALSTADPAAFRDMLEAAGVDPKLRESLLHTLLQHRYADRFRAVFPDAMEAARAEWWRSPDYRDWSSPAQVERQRAARRLQQEFGAELARLTGEDPRALDLEENPWLARQYDGLPRAKAEALHRLLGDYQEMEQDIHSESAGFTLPSDEEKLRLLNAERERDIAALLTPEERAAWDLRASPTADRARGLATQYRATEEEYRRLYALQRAFDERFDPGRNPHEDAPVDWESQRDAQRELESRIRTLVGDERYLAARRENDPDYAQARAAAERIGLPADTAAAVYSLREPVAEASGRIAADAALSPAQKREALARLAADTRAQVSRALGPTAAGLYFKRGGMRWLEELGRGSRLELDEDGDTRLSAIAGVEPDPAPAPIIRLD